MNNKIGTKFICSICKSEFILMKIGKSEFRCCNQPLEQKK